MLWLLLIISMTGDIHYEEFGYGPENEEKCWTAAAVINSQTKPRIDAFCFSAQRYNDIYTYREG